MGKGAPCGDTPFPETTPACAASRRMTANRRSLCESGIRPGSSGKGTRLIACLPEKPAGLLPTSPQLPPRQTANLSSNMLPGPEDSAAGCKLADRRAKEIVNVFLNTGLCWIVDHGIGDPARFQYFKSCVS